jgi:methylenetetrahydrofolate dehydrogenase (NADP+) / methenyltetrahydrofolate cyclohydrolase
VGDIIDGKLVAKRVESEVAQRVKALREQSVEPCLAVVLVGDNAASHIYVRRKEKACARVGMKSKAFTLPDDTSEEEVLRLVQELNNDPLTHGILVQLPLPSHINSYAITNAIDPWKDVDGFHFVNAGHLATDRTGLAPCTPKGIMRLLREYDVTLRGAHAVVVGRSRIVGRPMGAMLLAADATVTTCHRHTPQTSLLTGQADIVIVAVGKPGLIRGDWVKPGVVVIDVGINRLEDRRIVGDVAYDEVAPKAKLITPVPGGVGPMTISMLLENTCEAAERMLPNGPS